MKDHNWAIDLSAGEEPLFGRFAVAGGGHVFAGVTKAMAEHPYLREDVNLRYANAQVRFPPFSTLDIHATFMRHVHETHT
jgi:hypothetical protein